MTVSLGASGELAELAKAIGLLDASGNFDVSWFSDPLTPLRGALRTASQRRALVRFFDLALPPTPEPGRPANEKWHPLLGTQTNGNLYLTLRDTGNGVVLGVGGDFHSGGGAAVGGRLRAQADVISATSTVDLVVGTASHPLIVEVRVETAWPFDPAGGHPVGLGAITGRAEIVPDPTSPSSRLEVTLEQVSLGGEPPIDKVLDVADLGGDVPDVLAALLKVVLAEAPVDASTAMLANHLLGIFGLADADDIPAFPFADLGDGPVALQRWLGSLAGTDGTTPPTVGPWLEHFAGLLGAADPFSGTGEASNPWRAKLVAITGVGELVATVARVDGHLRVGLGGSIGASLGAGEPRVAVEAATAIADLPLGGTGHARVLPEATLAVRITGDAGAPLVNHASVRIGTALAGVAYDGTRLSPTIVLLDNALAGIPYPRLDLTNTDSVASAAADLVINAIDQALGPNVGHRIAALAGIIAPEDPANPGTRVPGWPHHLDLPTFVVTPPAAIGAYHLAVLGDGDRWSLLMRELSGLVGLGTAISGTGSATQPWFVTIAGPAGGPALQLMAWHGPAPDTPTTQQLRVGLRLMAQPGGAELSWTSEVLAFDLPAAGPASIRLVGEQRLRLALDSAVDTSNGHLDVHLDSLEATAVWTPGASLRWQIRAQALSLSAEGDSTQIAELHLPPAAGFDLHDLGATAASLGLGIGDLEHALRSVLSLFAILTGPPEQVATALLGLHHRLSGLSEDTPTIVDPAQPGLTLRDPLGALRGFLARLVAHVGTAGEASAAVLLEWLAALGGGGLPDDIHADAAPDLLVGAGTFADPWRVSWPGGPDEGGPDLELWLEPEGPPSAWAGGLVTQAQAATDPADLAGVVSRLSWLDPVLRSIVGGLSRRDIAERLLALQTHFNAGDGVVAADSQGPDIFGWLHGAAVDAAHHRLPTHPDVISQTLAQVEALMAAGPTPRTVLLVGPSFTDHTIWADLLAAPQRQGPTDAGAHFDLRAPGIDPKTISLDGVTAVADWYTADLADDRSGDVAFMAGQLAHIAERLAVLHPGPLVVVAHSYAGLAARRFAADHPDRVLGLVTLGTPHLGAPLAFLSDVELGDAVRIAGAARPNMPASLLRDALDHLVAAVEGYVPPAAPGALATPNPYPSRSFGMAAPFDIGDIPVLTLQGIIADDVFAWLKAAIVAHAQQVAAIARPAPTHLSFGMSMPMAMGSAPFGTPEAVARTRFGLGQIPLADGVAPRPAHLLRVELELRRGNGWLVGGPANSEVDGRLRRLLVALTASHGPAGVQAAVDLALDQAAWRGVTSASAGLTDPIAAPLVGAGFTSVLASTDDADTPVSSLASALAAIDLLCTDANGVVGLSSDAFLALRTDPVGYLRARVPAALARPTGWAGLTANEALEGTYTWAPPGSPYALFARRDGLNGPCRVGIETDTASTPAETTNLGVDVDIALPSFEPTVELFLNIGAASLHYRTADGTITLDAAPWIDGFVLWPTPALDDLAARLNEALPRLLMSGAVAGVLGEIAPGLKLTMLERLLRMPGEFLMGALGLDGGGLDVSTLSTVLSVMNDAIGLPAGPGLQLPGDVSIVAGAGSVPNSARLAVTTTAPIGGVLALGFTVDIDPLRHVAPGGTVTISTPLTGTWPHVDIAFGMSPAGVTLVVTPQGVAPITLLPMFSGLGALRGAAAALLPAVLDAAVGTFPDPKPQWLQHALAVATHLDIYDAGGGFAAHTPAFAAMLEATWFDDFDTARQAGVAAAVVDLVTTLPGLPGTLSSSGGLVHWTLAMPTGAGTLDVAAGWGATGAATVQLGLADVQPASAPLVLSASATLGDDDVDVALSVGVDLTSIGIEPIPRVIVDLTSAPPARFRVRVAPLSGPGTDGPLVVNLAPAFGVDAAGDTAEQILIGWALPLAIQVAVQAAEPMLPRHLWSGGPTLQEALANAGIVDGGGHVAHPLPSIFQMAAGFLSAAASLLDLPLGELHLKLVDEAGRVGVGVSGQQRLPLGDFELAVAFGAPATWGPAASEGLLILLLDTTGADIAFNFGVELHGVGVGLAKSDGTALVAETFLRLGSVRAVLFLDIETEPDFHVLHGGAGLELGGFGLPISAALGSGGGSNPVASNLLGSGGSGSGDAQSVNPSADLDVWYWDHPANVDGPLRVLVGGQEGIFWIPIHAGFGPIFISEIGLGISNTAAALAIDGGVSIAGLSAQVDQLSVTVPYAHVTDPSQWSLDLKGLAIGYSGPAIAIAGGLVKFDGPPVEYDGMLIVKISSIGAIVIGSYSVVGSGADQYTSLAIFGGIFVPIGLTPIINLTGIALGLGYNRRLIVPEDLNQIPNFMLVKALDRPEALANNPMQALFAFHEQVPPARGALWLAAGLRGTSFEIVNITAVLYVALDRGVDVGLLGVARMALPADDAAIVSIELALKARFSTSEGLFSVQAQLTDNSWLITHDCQLTGGFAFFMWFRRSQFLLTIGGYHPSFQPLPEYPVVPRVGYRWNFLGVVQIKGEAYFALTNTAVMTGTRMEATYGPDWIQVWFVAYTDILIAWDPFHYEVDIGISVGARLRIRVCFFACCTIEISVSVGASLHLAGPPFHGSVTADLGVTSVTVPFGDDARPLPPAKHWIEFVDQYVKSNDPNAGAVSAQVTAGLLPAEPAGAPVAPGTAEQPWRLAAEWAFDTSTRMPARGFVLQVDVAHPPSQMATFVFGRYDDLDTTYDFDIAPMYTPASDLTSVHRVVVAKKPEGGGAFADMVPRTSPPPADASLIVDEQLFRVTPTIGQLSEATYHFFPDLKPPAAANTLPALVGLHLEGVAGLHNESQPIPIGTLVDATDYRPLPFAHRTPIFIGEVLKAGQAWSELAKVAVGADTKQLLQAFGTIVSGAGNEFSELRAASGLKPPGYGPVATDALVSRRSAPPVLSALSEGFTLEPVDRGVPEPVAPRGEVAGVELTAPRLRAVMQHSVVPAGGIPTIHTSVPPGRIPVVNVGRDLITSWSSPGVALLLRPAAAKQQETRAARSIRTLRHPALGGAVGRKAARALAALADAVRRDGVTLRAGAVHVWELPGAAAWRLEASGPSGVRITELTSAGTVLRDREVALDRIDIDLAPACAMVAVGALGRLAAAVTGRRATSVGARPESRRGDEEARPGLIALTASPPGTTPVVGWQIGSHVAQVGPTTLLGRGSVITLAKPIGSNLRRHVAATGIIALSRAMLDQEVVETHLPPSVEVVGVVVDRGARSSVATDDIVIHAAGAALGEAVLQVEAGNRTVFLYDVAAEKTGAATISVTAGLRAGLNLAGVFGGFSSAAAWAHSLAGTTLTQIVPDEQLSAEGEVRVRLVARDAKEAGNG